MKIYNITRDKCLAHTTIMADTFLSRLRGLLGRPLLPEGWCMVLKPCSSVHTMFMAFPIDVLFIDKDYRVVEGVENLAPFRFSRIVRNSRMVIELPAGSLTATGTSPGDIIEFNREK